MKQAPAPTVDTKKSPTEKDAEGASSVEVSSGE
jgi:hypothetical protein